MTTSEPPEEHWSHLLPRKREASGALFFDARGRVLIVKPTYTDGRDYPGGVVERDEAPYAAATRDPEPEVRTAGVPSGTNLLGLINHLTFVERSMFLGDRVTDWQSTFHAAPDDSVADILARYRETVAQANEVLDGCTDLAAPVPRPRSTNRAPSLRWALTHMIEETGRHAGHADILRELIDGRTGR